MNPSTSYKVPWSGRGHLYTEEEIKLVAEMMQVADPLTQGQHQKNFEQKFSKMHGMRPSFALSSATAALELSAVLCGLTKEDEVIIPGHTFAATAIPFGRTGAKIVWADLDPKTFVVTAETLSKCITPRTKAIVVVHLYGLVAEMDSIMALAKKHNLLVVEDAAQVLGAKYKGEAAGAIGDFGCFSFHSHKNLTTLGEGGMITVKNPELAKQVVGLRHNGIAFFPEDRKDYWLPASTNVDFATENVWPYNFCLGEIQCALGAKLLDRVDEVNAFRRKRADKITAALKNFPELRFQEVGTDPEQTSRHLLPAVYESPNKNKNRDDLIRMLANEFKVKCVIQYNPLYRYPLFQKAGFGKADCPNTDYFFDNMISFPFQEFLSEPQVDYLIESIQRALTILRG